MVNDYLEKERNYEELERLALLCRVPMPKAFITLEVFDKNGKLLQKHRQRSHSWTRNAYNMMFSQLAGKNADDNTFGAGKLSVKELTGDVRYDDKPFGQYDATVDGTDLGYRAPAGEDGRGILVGSGINAEDFEDYVLQTQITDGTGAGQISHTQSQAHAITWTGGTLTFKNDLIRYFNNNSAPAGDRAINEVCIAAKCMADGAAKEVMMSRDHLASTVTVPSTGQLKVTYTISLTYPA